MKKFLIILFLTLIWNLANAQKFDLVSNEFKVGEVYLSNPKILFDFAKWTIRKESYSHLDSIAEFLARYDSLIVEIGIHTDSRGSDNYSMRLDKKRAESIMEYLIKQGVDSDRLSAEGYGKTELIISDEKIEKMKTAQEREEAHAVNRRTEFKIIEIKK
ncbi:MAG: OmpA family protein [Flavobacteriales bacterium]